MEADGFIKSDGSEDFYALLLCETLQSAVCLLGCGKYSVLRLRERVERERNHKLLTVEHQVLDEFHLLCGKAAERVDKHRIAAENLGVSRQQLIYSVNIVERIDVRRRKPAAEHIKNVGGIEQLLFESFVDSSVCRLAELFGSNAVLLALEECVEHKRCKTAVAAGVKQAELTVEVVKRAAHKNGSGAVVNRSLRRI